MHINELVEFCTQNDIYHEVDSRFGRFSAGGRFENNVDMTSYRADQSKKVVGDIWYSKYNLRFDVKTGEVIFPKYSEYEVEFDIRNHELWDK